MPRPMATAARCYSGPRTTPASLRINENPVILNISGSMNNVILQVPKLAEITVDGDMNSCSFYGENLNA